MTDVRIHPTAIVAAEASLAPAVEIGPYAVVGPYVVLEKGVQIGAHACLEGRVRVGEGVQIYPGAIVGTSPQDRETDPGIDSGVIIGAGTVLREYVTVHKATREGESTRIGENVLLMAQVHIAHDCVVGDDVNVANATMLAGFVEVEAGTFISGFCAFHQFVRIGQLAMVGGMSKITQDVPPFHMVTGNPAVICGLNQVGLRRGNYDRESRRILKEIHRILYRSSMNTQQALKLLEQELGHHDLCLQVMDFVQNSRRGIMKKRE